jgi:hypothetical protein
MTVPGGIPKNSNPNGLLASRPAGNSDREDNPPSDEAKAANWGDRPQPPLPRDSKQVEAARENRYSSEKKNADECSRAWTQRMRAYQDRRHQKPDRVDEVVEDRALVNAD